MSDGTALESTDLTERIVLFELARRDRRGETPTPALDLLDGCRRLADDLEDVPAGKLSEADLVRACRSLADDGLVSERRAGETSPVGKGRPDFGLAVDPEHVADLLDRDERLSALADQWEE